MSWLQPKDDFGDGRVAAVEPANGAADFVAVSWVVKPPGGPERCAVRVYLADLLLAVMVRAD
jgi:hypothetical protein